MKVVLPFVILMVAMLAFMPLILRLGLCLNRSAPSKAYLRPATGLLLVWCATWASFIFADRTGIDPVTIHAAPVAIGIVPFSVLVLIGINWLQHLTSS